MSKRYVYAAYVDGKPAIDKDRKLNKNKFPTLEEAQWHLENFFNICETEGFSPDLIEGQPTNFDGFIVLIKKEVARGRPAGANSFVTVKMADLQQYLGPEGVVKVSKIWLQELGLTVKEAVATIEATEERQEEEKPIEFKMVDFSDD